MWYKLVSGVWISAAGLYYHSWYVLIAGTLVLDFFVPLLLSLVERRCVGCVWGGVCYVCGVVPYARVCLT